MKCSEMKPMTLYDRVVSKFSDDEKFYIIPADKQSTKDGINFEAVNHKRISRCSSYDYLLEYELGRWNKWIDEPMKYEYFSGLGEAWDDDCDTELSFCDNIIKRLGHFIWSLKFKTVTKTTFGKPIRIGCFSSEWIIEAHGDMVCLVKMSSPMRYMTTWLNVNSIKEDCNLLKIFVREILFTSMNTYKNRQTDLQDDNDILINDYWMNYFWECIEQEDRYIGITLEECYPIIKQELTNIYNRILEYDFKKYKTTKEFYEEMKDDPILNIETNFLK